MSGCPYRCVLCVRDSGLIAVVGLLGCLEFLEATSVVYLLLGPFQGNLGVLLFFVEAYAVCSVRPPNACEEFGPFDG